ncbi:hypothetical protein [Pararobbsia alpina]|nr:hypothetical protein [Pararobbsia alpina]
MQPLFGSPFAFIAGVLFYLASPRQQIKAQIQRRRTLLVAGAPCGLAGAALWHGCANRPAVLCATITTLAASLSAMPFIGMMASRRAKLASPADARPSARVNRPTGTP